MNKKEQIEFLSRYAEYFDGQSPEEISKLLPPKPMSRSQYLTEFTKQSNSLLDNIDKKIVQAAEALEQSKNRRKKAMVANEKPARKDHASYQKRNDGLRQTFFNHQDTIPSPRTLFRENAEDQRKLNEIVSKPSDDSRGARAIAFLRGKLADKK